MYKLTTWVTYTLFFFGLAMSTVHEKPPSLPDNFGRRLGGKPESDARQLVESYNIMWKATTSRGERNLVLVAPYFETHPCLVFLSCIFGFPITWQKMFRRPAVSPNKGVRGYYPFFHIHGSGKFPEFQRNSSSKDSFSISMITDAAKPILHQEQFLKSSWWDISWGKST